MPGGCNTLKFFTGCRVFTIRSWMLEVIFYGMRTAEDLTCPPLRRSRSLLGQARIRITKCVGDLSRQTAYVWIVAAPNLRDEPLRSWVNHARLANAETSDVAGSRQKIA